MADPAPDPTPDPKPDPPKADPPAPAPTPDPAPKFTPVTSQEQFDRMVQDRIAREQKKFADYDDLKAKAGKYDELEAKNQSELEKANARAAKLEREAEDARLHAQETTVKSSIITAAVGKLADPSDAVALIDRASLDFDDEGNPTNVGDAIETLLKAKPHLAAGGPRGDADQGARGGNGVDQLTREQLQTMTPQQIVAARREGKVDHLLAGS
jgi:hypothetical protein